MGLTQGIRACELPTPWSSREKHGTVLVIIVQGRYATTSMAATGESMSPGLVEKTRMRQAVIGHEHRLLCKLAGKARALLAGAVLCCTLAPARFAEAAPRSTDPRETSAHEAFAEGRYQDALDLYAKLYAKTLHPTYLRSIGRCYQNLQQPDTAINAFRDYLRQAKDIPPSERSEVEGYIAEMENFKKTQEDELAIHSPPPPPPPPPEQRPIGPSNAGTTGAVNLRITPPPPPLPHSEPIYKRGWVWGIVGGVVVAVVVGGLAAAGVFSTSGQCPSGVNCKNLTGNNQ